MGAFLRKQWLDFKDLTEALLQENKKMNKLFIFLSEPKQPPQSDRYPATGKKRIPLSRGGGGVEARCCECTLWLMLEARHWRSQHAYFLSSVQSSWETLCAVAAGTFWSLAYLKTEKKKKHHSFILWTKLMNKTAKKERSFSLSFHVKVWWLSLSLLLLSLIS